MYLLTKIKRTSLMTIFIISTSIPVYAIDLVDRSLICKTKKFPVKGGFYFINKSSVIKYNILYDISVKSQYLHSTTHCYKIIKNEIILSDTNKQNNCGSYRTSINLGSLIYTIPTDNGYLSAECDYYNGDLEKKLKSSLNIDIN